MRLVHSLVAIAALGGAALIAHARPMRAQDPPPFTVGERLVYRVRVGRTGAGGRATMAVTGPIDVRGVSTELLRFDFSAGFGPMRVAAHTQSWLDPHRMAALRFAKQEHSPLSRHDESVELFGSERRWTATDGEAGDMPSDAPLDELSFIYFIRTLPLAPGGTWELNRHFEAARNPTVIRVVGPDTVVTEAGAVGATLVEMRVRDSERYHGDGVIRLYISDDACHVPVRIESQIPVAGRVVLTLESHTGVVAGCTLP